MPLIFCGMRKGLLSLSYINTSPSAPKLSPNISRWRVCVDMPSVTRT